MASHTFHRPPTLVGRRFARRSSGLRPVVANAQFENPFSGAIFIDVKVKMEAKQVAAEKARCEKFRDYAIQGASECSA